MKIKTVKHYDEDGLTIVTIQDKDKEFIGIATCHPDDMDMKNDITGETIATQRALIEYQRHQRDYDIKPRLHELKMIKTTIEQSKFGNTDSYEYKTLCRHINDLEYTLADINNNLKLERASLEEYLNSKEELYQHLRTNRTKREKAETN